MDPKFVLPKITVEEPSNGRDDQHVYYRVLKDGEPISDWVGESRMYEIADEARERVRKEDLFRPEERRVLEIVDEIAAVQERLDEARKQIVTCRHVLTTEVREMTFPSPWGFDVDEICEVCRAVRRQGSDTWANSFMEYLCARGKSPGGEK